MANPHKGEYRVNIEGKDYVLRFSADTVCDIEEQLKLTIEELSQCMQDTKRLKMTLVRDLFVLGLSDKHPDLDEQARRLLFRGLGPVDAVSHVARAFALAFGVEGKPEDGQNPPLPGAVESGTGPDSTATGAE
jgi:hypothetical protein